MARAVYARLEKERFFSMPSFFVLF